jgi:hypothetical protein
MRLGLFIGVLAAIGTSPLLEGPANAQPAQSYEDPIAPLQPAANLRRGLTLGIGAGVGGMESSDGPIECADCADSVAGSFDAHIGFMVNPRLALMFEVWGAGQALDSQSDVTIVQVLAMGAAQYWVTPRIWIKGGLGTAHLSERYGDSEVANEIDTGAAVMGAVGAELISRPRFSMDLQLRGGSGTYEGIEDTITQASLQLGLSWY